MVKYIIRIITLVLLINSGYFGLVFSKPEGADNRTRDLLTFFKKVHKMRREIDQKSFIVITLTNSNGEKKVLKLIRVLKNYEEKDSFDTKTIFFTMSPVDVKGVNVLLWSYSVDRKDDDVWVYLPALKKVMRVPSKEAYSPFLGSDLTYADITPRRVDQDFIKFLKVEILDGTLCYVIEKVPIEKDAIYSKKIEWVSRKRLLPIKIDYYDKEGKFLKYQTIEWKKVNGKWTWKKIFVNDLQAEHSTIFEIKEIDPDYQIDDALFSKRALTYGIDEEGNIVLN